MISKPCTISGIDGDLFDSITSGEMGMKEYEVKIVFDQIAHAISVSRLTSRSISGISSSRLT